MACVDRSMPFAGTGWTVGDMLPRLLLASAQAYAAADQACAALEDLGRARDEVSSFPPGSAKDQLRRELAAATRTVERRPVRSLTAVGATSPGWVRLAPDLDDAPDLEGDEAADGRRGEEGGRWMGRRSS